MKGALAIRKPLETLCLDMSSTNITTSAYAVLIASKNYSCSGMEVLNPSSSPMKIAIGGSGSEVDIPYTIPQGGSLIFIPVEMKKADRLTAKAIGTSVSTGYLVINFFG